MTRINCIPPNLLCDQHLLAEHRELTRIPNGLLNGKLNPANKEGDNYTLGKGHVLFFTDKMAWLAKHYMGIHSECKAGGFKVTDNFPYSQFIGTDSWNDWLPDQNAHLINIERIIEKTPENARMKGFPISKENYTQIMRGWYFAQYGEWI